MSFLFALYILFIVSTNILLANFVFGDLQRKLVRDGDNNRVCFDLNYNQGYADYVNDPFKANGNRGSWGKCIPEEIFGALWYKKYKNKIFVFTI